MSVEASLDQLRERVKGSLQRGESLLWAGQPDPKRFWGEAVAGFILGLVFLGLDLAIVLLLIATGPALSLPLGLFGLIFFAAGFYYLLSPWWLPRRLRQTIYVLTDRRALIWHGVGWGADGLVSRLHEPYYEYGPEALCYHSRRRLSGRCIDLVFGEELHRSGRKGNDRIAVEIGFLGLARPEPVEQLLKERFACPRPDRSVSPALNGALKSAPLAPRVLVAILFIAFITPWFIIAAGLILVGGELWFCLFPGVLLVALFAYLGYYALRSPATIGSFNYDGHLLSYRTQSGKRYFVRVEEIVAITERRGLNGQDVSGWALEFRGGKRVFLSSRTANAAELVNQLRPANAG